MCGIVAVLPFQSTSHRATEAIVERALHLMVHRGPDEAQHFAFPNVRLGTCRLRTSGTASRGLQPTTTRSKRYHFCFNGSLSKYFQNDKWHKISASTSDTEIIARLIDKDGICTALNNLDGMFSLIVVDTYTDTVFMARDHFGIKPLYYGLIDGVGLVIVSDDRVLADLKKSHQIKSDSLIEFLRFGYLPKMGSILKQVFKVPVGSLLSVSSKNPKGGVQFEAKLTGYSVPRGQKAFPSVPQIRQVLADGLDSELGSCATMPALAISSGVDSLSLATISAEDLDIKLDTYFVSRVYDEEARQVERNMLNLGHRFNFLQLRDHDASLAYDAAITHMGSPLADMSVVPTHFLASKMKEDGVRIAFGGDGADELFIGYNRYWRILLYLLSDERARHGSQNQLSCSLGDLAGFFMGDQNWEKRDYFHPSFSREKFLSDYLNMMELFPRLPQASVEEHPVLDRGAVQSRLADHEALSIMRDWDCENYLCESVLRKVDLSFMANSIEYRVPFLSRQMWQSCSQLGLSLGDPHKKILREVVRSANPEMKFYPKKGFLLDVGKLIKPESKGLLACRLLEKFNGKSKGSALTSRQSFALSILHSWSVSYGAEAAVERELDLCN